MELSAAELDIIRKELEKNEVTMALLRDDLLDHLCCDVESRMTENRSFEQALDEAIGELAPKGLYEIQSQTNYLLYSSKLIPMKKMTYAFGLLSSMMMGTGWIMSMLHLPGAGSLTHVGIGSIGLIGFVFLFLPMFVISKFSGSPPMGNNEKSRIITGMTSGIIISIGLIFKLMHWPGANLLLLIGTIVFVFGFLPILFFGMYKKSVMQ